MVENFADRLVAAVRRAGNAVCVGLDPRWDMLPESFRGGGESFEAKAGAYERFCNDVSDAVAALAPVVKIQAAFFEELGPHGMAAMARVVDHAHERGLLVIVDGKRNDIGSTAEAYARAYLGRGSAWHADALTVSPYLGTDSLAPFIQVAAKSGAGLFVLVKTSNPGGRLLQELQTTSGAYIYQHMGSVVEEEARAFLGKCGYSFIGAVVGATYPDELAELRGTMPHTWFLVPGFGSQGGTAADVRAAFDSDGLGAIVNNSRGLIFAHSQPKYARFGASRWQDAVAAATREMIDELAMATCR